MENSAKAMSRLTITWAKLTSLEPMNISVPGIKELPLTLECKILYRMEQTLDTIPQDIIEKYYPNGDFHYAYYGQIVGAYIAE